MVKKKSSKPSKESQPRGKNYEKNQKRKAAKKAGKISGGKVKKEEKKVEKAVEKKMEQKHANKPKAGNVGYLGVFDGTKGRSKRKNNLVTVANGPDDSTSIYEGDWQGETCKTDSTGQNIFSATGDIVLINPKSLGPSVENEARNWRYWQIDEMELWIEPIQGIVNTPGNICTAIETDPDYFAASGATLDFDTVNSYRPHVDHPVYVQDKPIKLIYRRREQKTASQNEFYYTYFNGTQYATNSVNGAATGEVSANIRQCFQFAIISYCKSCTASTELGVWQMRVKINWRGNKKSQALPAFIEAERMADTVITQNHKTWSQQMAEYVRRTVAGESLRKPVWYPNPRLIDTDRVMIEGYRKAYVATGSKDLALEKKIADMRYRVECYDSLRNILTKNALNLNAISRPGPLIPADVTNPVSAMPVVIVDPSLSTDPRLAANSKAAKVGSDGTLQTSTAVAGVSDVRLMSMDGKNALRTESALDLSGGSSYFGTTLTHGVVFAGSNPSLTTSTAFPTPYAAAVLPAANGSSVNAGVPVTGSYEYPGVGVANRALGFPHMGVSTFVDGSSPTVTYGPKAVQSNSGDFKNQASVDVNGRTSVVAAGNQNVPLQQDSNGAQTAVICDATSNSQRAAVFSTGEISSGVNIRAVGGNNVVTTLPMNIVQTSGSNLSGGRVPTDVQAVNGTPISGSVLPTTISSSVTLPTNLYQISGSPVGTANGNIPVYITDQVFSNIANVTTSGSLQTKVSATIEGGESSFAAVGSDAKDSKIGQPKKGTLRTSSADPPKDRVKIAGQFITVVKWTCPKCKDVYDYGDKKEGCVCMNCGGPMVAEQTTLDKIAVGMNRKK